MPYEDHRLSGYLLTFYGAQGRPDLGRLAGQDFVLHRCEACSLIWQVEIPGAELMAEIYEKWIDPGIILGGLEKNRPLGHFTHVSREALRLCRLFLRPPADLVFLDYSMGWGHWCRAAQGFGVTAHGTEYSPARIAHARSHGVAVVDAERLVPGMYDAINAEQVFEHLPDPLATLQRLRAALAPEGWIRIAVPDGGDALTLLRDPDWGATRGTLRNLVSVAPLEHINCFNRNSLRTMGQNCGLRPVPAPPAVEWTIEPCGWSDLVMACLRPAWHALRRRKAWGIEMFFRHAGIKAEATR